MYELTVGSKVFLLGEYQVLNGGSAFLTVLEPRFQMRVNKGEGRLLGASEGSPAYRYFAENRDFFKRWDFEFKDPHQGRGGFGASTAQIALLQGFKEGFESFAVQAQVDFDLRKIHKKYLEMSSGNKGVQPSGADLIAQFQGGLVEVDLSTGKIQRHSWPFPQWQVLFFSTGKKLATHEHLSEIRDLDVENLRLIYRKAMEAFADGKANAFAQAFREYQIALALHGWQTASTGQVLEAINAMNGVVASKGCGAMGSDVIAVIVDSSKIEQYVSDIEALGVKYVGNLEHRTEGFSWKWVPQNLMMQTDGGVSCH